MQKVDFKPAWWLPNGHFQTIWPTIFRKPVKPFQLRRERLELPDGDFIDLDWAGKKEGPIVLLLHGLEGSIDSPYAKGMLQAIVQAGWRGVFMSFRGCSGEINRLPRAYHSGETTDVSLVVSMIVAREPNTPLAAIGFSLGGNVLLKWLGETGARNPLKAAIAISVPFELSKSANRINQGFSRIYQKHLLGCLQRKFDNKQQTQGLPFVIPSIYDLQTIRDFDEQVTAPLHGFLSAKDYYDQCSSRQFLHAIRIPTLLVQSQDDPFMTEDIVPDRFELSPTVKLELTEKGGHVGFISGRFPWRAEYWLEKRAPAYLQPYLS